MTDTDQNVHSIGILVEYGNFRSLITGDSEKVETDAWLKEAKYTSLLKDIDVYKSIHHGAKNGDAGNTAWMDAIAPEQVIIQVGANGYGHPTAESLATYGSYAVSAYRTDVDGKATVAVWPTGGYTLATEKSGVVFVSADPVAPDDVNNCPSTHTVKGNIGSERVYHVATGSYYKRTQPEQCFASTTDAAAAGFRASSR